MQPRLRCKCSQWFHYEQLQQQWNEKACHVTATEFKASISHYPTCLSTSIYVKCWTFLNNYAPVIDILLHEFFSLKSRRRRENVATSRLTIQCIAKLNRAVEMRIRNWFAFCEIFTRVLTLKSTSGALSCNKQDWLHWLHIISTHIAHAW